MTVAVRQGGEHIDDLEVVDRGGLDPEIASVSGDPLPARTRTAELGAATPRSRKPPGGLQVLVHHDVELRTLNGGCYRGELIAVTPEWALLERRTGRLALIRLAAVAAACDENFLGGRS